jgi:signal transduction histidine kinase
MSGADAATDRPPDRWLSVLGSASLDSAPPINPPMPQESSTAADGTSMPGPQKLSLLFERPLLVALLFCVAYVAVDAATNVFTGTSMRSTPWNPQAALALALIATRGLRFVPAVAVAVFFGELLVRGTAPGITSVFSAAAVAAAYGAAGWALQRFTRWTRAEVTLRDLSVLVLIAFAASLAVALLLSLTHALAGTVSLQNLHVVSLQVVIGEALGLVVAAPALLLLASGAWRAESASTSGRGRLGRELLLFAAVLAAVLLVIFGLRPFDEFRLSYLLFVPMIVMAARHGLFGVALAVPLVQVGLIAALWFFDTQAATAFEFQALMLALALTAMYLGLLSSERERAAQRLAARERELREQRNALNEAQRTAATAELSAALAHDLNQPLSAIGTYARAARLLAEREETDRDTLFRALDQIASESARAGQYVRRMRDFFRTGTMHSERVPVGQLFDSAHAHLRDRLQRANIEYQSAVDDGLPPLRIDTVQVGTVLDNLLGNACDALADSPAPRRIRVTAARLASATQATVRITVQDNGPGVPIELRQQLFKPLATSKPHGMGLGLALSRSIAERLGGGLSFDAGNSVTTFYLDLPTDE